LSTSKGITSTPFAPGFYHFEVTGGEETQSRAGNQMFVHTLKILEGPEQERKIDGTKMTARFPITDSEFTVDKLKNFVSACGLRIGSDDGYDPAKAIGKTPWGRVAMGTGAQGAPQSECKEFYTQDEYKARAASAPAAEED
jgi:hypothetical protein